MEYREFGKTGLKPSILGFGMMRLPKNEDGSLNEQWAIETLRKAIDNGLTYVDTAYAYKDSERVTGLCLQDGYREKVTLATKLPVWMVNNQEDFDRVLGEELDIRTVPSVVAGDKESRHSIILAKAGPAKKSGV